MLNDVIHVDSRSTFMGQPVRLPVMLAPVGGMESFVEGGAAAAAKGAAAFGIPQMLSSVCQPGLEVTAAVAETLRVFQLYVRGDDAWVDDWVVRARANGFTAFCLTVDSAFYSRREPDIAELTPRHLAAAPVVFEPSVLSAFPLLDLYDKGTNNRA